MLDTRVEVREGEVLLCTVRRPPHRDLELEVLDAREDVIGVLERGPWSQMTGAVWVTSPSGKKLLQLRPKFPSGQCLFVSADGKEVGEMLTEAAHDKRPNVAWHPHGGNYYARFDPALEARPKEKLLFLAAALGLDLFSKE
jgi:hypothetical protein